MKQEKIMKLIKYFLGMLGLSGNLLFLVAINTLFLTVVKNFNASQL